MTHTIELSELDERELTKRVAKTGLSMETILNRAVANYLAEEQSTAEILAPFRQDVAESGMTEAQLDEFFQGVRQEVWDEQHGVAK